MEIVLKSFAVISKMVWDLAKPKLERQQWLIAALRGSGYEVLKPDFESIYAHALVEYAYEAYPEENAKIWVDFFALKATSEYIKQHLYKKEIADLTNVLDGLLHTGQGQTFLTLKNSQAQTKDVMVQYGVFKKYLDQFTIQSRNPEQNQHFELSQKLLEEVKNIQKSLLTITQDSQKNAVIRFDDTEILLKIESLQNFVVQNQMTIEAVQEKLEGMEDKENNWQEWRKKMQEAIKQIPPKPQIQIENSKNVITNTQIGNVSGDFIVGDNNKTSTQNAEKIYNIGKIDDADFK
jgi:hypothetical protein